MAEVGVGFPFTLSPLDEIDLPPLPGMEEFWPSKAPPKLDQETRLIIKCIQVFASNSIVNDENRKLIAKTILEIEDKDDAAFQKGKFIEGGYLVINCFPKYLKYLIFKIDLKALPEPLFSGGTGTIHKIQNLADNAFYALKLPIDVPAIACMQRSFTLLSSMQSHPNLQTEIYMLEVDKTVATLTPWGEGGDLFTVIQRDLLMGQIKPVLVKMQWCLQIFSAIAALQEQKKGEEVFHGDPTSNNFVFFSEGGNRVLKLIDFDGSRRYQDEEFSFTYTNSSALFSKVQMISKISLEINEARSKFAANWDLQFAAVTVWQIFCPDDGEEYPLPPIHSLNKNRQLKTYLDDTKGRVAYKGTLFTYRFTEQTMRQNEGIDRVQIEQIGNLFSRLIMKALYGVIEAREAKHEMEDLLKKTTLLLGNNT